MGCESISAVWGVSTSLCCESVIVLNTTPCLLPSCWSNNQPKAPRKQQQPTKSLQQITATNHKPLKNNTNLQKSFDEIIGTNQKHPKNNSNPPKASTKSQQPTNFLK